MFNDEPEYVFPPIVIDFKVASPDFVVLGWLGVVGFDGWFGADVLFALTVIVTDFGDVIKFKSVSETLTGVTVIVAVPTAFAVIVYIQLSKARSSLSIYLNPTSCWKTWLWFFPWIIPSPSIS